MVTDYRRFDYLTDEAKLISILKYPHGAVDTSKFSAPLPKAKAKFRE